MAPLLNRPRHRNEPCTRRSVLPASGLALGQLRGRSGHRAGASVLRRELEASALLEGRRGREAPARALRRVRARLCPLLTIGVCPGTDTGVGALPPDRPPIAR